MERLHKTISGHLKMLLQWLAGQEGAPFVALLVAALALRLVLAPVLMISGDAEAYMAWGNLTHHHFFHVYSAGANNNWLVVPEYPPFAMYVYGFLDIAYFGTAHLFGYYPPHQVTQVPSLMAVLKLPGILADLGATAFIYAIARRRLARVWAWLVAASYAFTPAILIVVLVWGQTDGFVLLLAILALWAASHQRAVLSGIFLGLAVGFKPQPVIFIPLAVVYLFGIGGWKVAARTVVSLAATTFVLWLPYLLPPRPEIFAWRADVATVLSAEGLHATNGAFNLWKLLHPAGNKAGAAYLGPLTPGTIGTALFAIAMVMVLAGYLRRPEPAHLWAGAAVVAIAFFDVTTMQFERYVFPLIGLCLLAALYNRRFWALYALFSLTGFLNMLYTFMSSGGIVLLHLGRLTGRWRPVLPVPLRLIHGAVLFIALVNVAALGYAIVTYLKMLHPRWSTEYDTSPEYGTPASIVSPVVARAQQ